MCVTPPRPSSPCVRRFARLLSCERTYARKCFTFHFLRNFPAASCRCTTTTTTTTWKSGGSWRQRRLEISNCVFCSICGEKCASRDVCPLMRRIVFRLEMNFNRQNICLRPSRVDVAQSSRRASSTRAQMTTKAATQERTRRLTQLRERSTSLEEAKKNLTPFARHRRSSTARPPARLPRSPSSAVSSSLLTNEQHDGLNCLKGAAASRSECRQTAAAVAAAAARARNSTRLRVYLPSAFFALSLFTIYTRFVAFFDRKACLIHLLNTSCSFVQL